MNSSTILSTLKTLSYESIPSSWYRHISDWDAWYRGTVPDFHDYKVFNGLRHVRCRKLTAGMAKNVAESWADLLMNATLSITLEGKREQEFFDAVCASNNFRQMMNLYEEYTFALGTSAIVLRLTGVPVDAEGKLLRPKRSKHYMPELAIDFVRADGIFPLSWENGVVRECAFATSHTVSGREYLYLQLHLLQPDATYRIENRLYTAPDSSSSDSAILTEVPLETLPATRGIAPVFLTQSPEPLFFINTPNIANNLAPEVPMGVSVFANAVDQLMDCDNIFDSLNSEFVLGRKRIMVKPEAIRNLEGGPSSTPTTSSSTSSLKTPPTAPPFMRSPQRSGSISTSPVFRSPWISWASSAASAPTTGSSTPGTSPPQRRFSPRTPRSTAPSRSTSSCSSPSSSASPAPCSVWAETS